MSFMLSIGQFSQLFKSDPEYLIVDPFPYIPGSVVVLQQTLFWQIITWILFLEASYFEVPVIRLNPLRKSVNSI